MYLLIDWVLDTKSNLIENSCKRYSLNQKLWNNDITEKRCFLRLKNTHFSFNTKFSRISIKKKHEKSKPYTQELSTAVLGSRVQVLLEVTFLLDLFCSNTTLAELAE